MDTPPPSPSYVHAAYLLALSEHVKAIGIYNQTLRDGDVSPADRAMLLEVTRYLCEDSGAQGFPLIAEHARILGKLLAAPAPLAHLVLSQKLANLYEICNAAIELEEAEGPQPQENKPVIAVVDDDPMMRLALTKLLEKEAQVFTGKNSHDAVTLMRTHKPALVLMDDIMPGGLTGLSLLEEVQKDPELSRIPIVMVTASSDKEHVLRGLRAGAAEYVTKPVAYVKLMEVVHKILARRENCVALYLDDADLAQAITQRLEALKCKVQGGFSTVQDFVGFVRDQDALGVFDGELINPAQAAQLPSLCPKASFLYVPEPQEPIAPLFSSPPFTALDEPPTSEAIVRAIGRLLAARRMRSA